MRTRLGRQDALLLVDCQKDFFPGGALAVGGADEIIPVLNGWIEAVRRAGGAVYATRDWHPSSHSSFVTEGGPWPIHCVKNSEGASFHPDLKLPPETSVISKGEAPQEEVYSAFRGTDLARRLRHQGIVRLWVGGLAQDFCVKVTVLDALKAGFEVHLIKPATRPLDLRAGDGDEALRQMRTAGAVMEGESQPQPLVEEGVLQVTES